MTKSEIIIYGIENEGGDEYTNDPDDAGDETKFGISKAAHPDVDIKNLTLGQAVDIYEREYWKEWYDKISDKGIVMMVYDFGLPQGPIRSIMTLQLCMNKYYGHGLEVDGVIGRKTVGAVNSVWDKMSLRSAFVLEAVEEIKRDASKRNNMKYILGWTNRLLRDWARAWQEF